MIEMAIQDIRNKAKSTIHDAFSVQCDYYVVGSGSPLTIPVRKYQTDEDVINAGDISSQGWSTMGEQPTYLVFDLNDIDPARGDRVVIGADEYQIDRPLQPINGYTKCEVRKL